MAKTYELLIDQGSTLSVLFTLKDEAGTALNLTGYTVRMQIRSSYASSIVVLNLSTTLGTILLDPLLGKITITATAAVTAALPAKRYVYDIETVSASGFVTRFVQGNVVVSPEVTR